jgi:hypothetical protein
VPRKPLELSDRDDPVSPTVPALQLELHHPAPRSLLCMDASFCVLRCRVLRRAKIIAGAGGESRHMDPGTKMRTAMDLAAPLVHYMRTRRRRRRSAKSRRLHNGAGCAPAAAPPDPPVPSREAIFGRRAVEASGWDGGRPGGHRHHSPYPSVSSFSLHLLLGGAVCAVPRAAPDYSRSARYACLLCAQVWL